MKNRNIPAKGFTAVRALGLIAGLMATSSVLAQDSTFAPATGSPSDIAELRRMLEAQAREISELRGQLEKIQQAEQDAPRPPVFKAAPDHRDGDFSFKLRGRLQYDVGYISNPRGAIPTDDFGLGSRIRRAFLGVEGDLPAGFFYRLEADIAENNVAIADAYLQWRGEDMPLWVRLGHQQTFQGLEQMTSDRFTSFMERSQIYEAFNHDRRLGIGLGFQTNQWLLTAGIFNDGVVSEVGNDDRLIGARLVWAPTFGDSRLHLGANYQNRHFQPSEQNAQYRFRNAARLSSIRLVDTGLLAASGDETIGLEAAYLRGPFHLTGEVQWAKPKTLSGSPSGGSEGEGSFIAENPTFNAWYVEAGYWLTGETRGYEIGEWTRTKVKSPINDGGPGAIGVNVRFDRLDLADRALATGPDGSLFKGGQQDIWLASLVWQPIDYVRIIAQYNHNRIKGGPFAGVVVPRSNRPASERSYNQDTVAMRVQYDF